ncbi:MAG: FliM/FliN family flagellar motor switch protein [Armatimonadota bacterium]|nr:FliM/FliN family flagellar motor switch protein [Armatimonadota bacterium]
MADERDEEREAAGEDITGLQSGAMAALSQLALPLSVRIGTTTLALQELLELRAGSVVTLDRGLDAPVEVLVGERVVARGELVAVDEEMGVRITEIRGAQGGS